MEWTVDGYHYSAKNAHYIKKRWAKNALKSIMSYPPGHILCPLHQGANFLAEFWAVLYLLTPISPLRVHQSLGASCELKWQLIHLKCKSLFLVNKNLQTIKIKMTRTMWSIWTNIEEPVCWGCDG